MLSAAGLSGVILRLSSLLLSSCEQVRPSDTPPLQPPALPPPPTLARIPHIEKAGSSLHQRLNTCEVRFATEALGTLRPIQIGHRCGAVTSLYARLQVRLPSMMRHSEK